MSRQHLLMKLISLIAQTSLCQLFQISPSGSQLLTGLQIDLSHTPMIIIRRIYDCLKSSRFIKQKYLYNFLHKQKSFYMKKKLST